MPWQHLALQLRKQAYLAMFSARGGGKTFLMSTAAIAHCNELGRFARPLVVREQFKSMTEWGDDLYEMAVSAWGSRVTRNKASGEISLPTGGVITMAHVSTPDGVRVILGRNFTACYADEVGNYPASAFTFLARARSSVRPPPPFKEEVMFAGNFGGQSHARILREYYNLAPPWTPYLNKYGEVWVNAPSSYRENPYINAKQYARQLLVACAGDQGLYEAWDKGVPSGLSGTILPNWDPNVHVVGVPERAPYGRYVVGVDWGTKSPSTATLLCLLSEPFKFGDRILLPGDVVAIDGTDTVADPLREDLSVGTGATPYQLGILVREMLDKWHIPEATCVVDDARGLEDDTVVDAMKKVQGVRAERVRKRTLASGYQMLRAGLQRAVDRERHGFYVANTPLLDALRRTIPELPRDANNPEIACKKFVEDHHIDGWRYGVEHLAGGATISQARMIGGY